MEENKLSFDELPEEAQDYIKNLNYANKEELKGMKISARQEVLNVIQMRNAYIPDAMIETILMPEDDMGEDDENEAKAKCLANVIAACHFSESIAYAMEQGLTCINVDLSKKAATVEEALESYKRTEPLLLCLIDGAGTDAAVYTTITGAQFNKMFVYKSSPSTDGMKQYVNSLINP